MVFSETDIAAFLSNSDAWGPNLGRVDTLETHISRIFMCGERVLKLKRHVRYPYLDFTTLHKRKQACEAEVLINRRTAPELYKGIISVNCDDAGHLHLDGAGEVVDWLVEMIRFDQDGLFDQMAKAGKLDRPLMERTADVISDFHQGVDHSPSVSGRSAAADVLQNNRQCFIESCPQYFTHDAVQNLYALYDAKMATLERVLDERSEAGLVRHCHGDLHLGNICLFEDQPTLFDAIEFNEGFSHIDILYDLAFLLMDLEYNGLRRLANAVVNRYFDVNGRAAEDAGNFQVLSLFLSIRAAVRSHVNATQAKLLDDPIKIQQRAEDALRYFDMAVDYLQVAPPRLIAVGGLSGSGKSRLARNVAAFVGTAPGARVVRTDVTRKRLAGSDLHQRLGPEGYTVDMNARTYEAFYKEIQKCLNEGQSVIADAVFARPGERHRIEELASANEVTFDGLWLEASRDEMMRRVTERINNVSDAGTAVVDQQLDYDLGEITWHHVDSSGSREQTLESGLRALDLEIR